MGKVFKKLFNEIASLRCVHRAMVEKELIIKILLALTVNRSAYTKSKLF